MRKFLFVGLICMAGYVKGQTVTPSILNTSGGTYTNANSYYRFDWSVGEMTIIETFVKPTVILTNGVLQPGTEQKPISPFTQIFGKDEYRIFPNPTTGKFEFDITLDQKGDFIFALLDASGKMISKQSFFYSAGGLSKIVKFDITNFANGVYSLYVTFQPNGSTRKSFFKIIKLPK